MGAIDLDADPVRMRDARGDRGLASGRQDATDDRHEASLDRDTAFVERRASVPDRELSSLDDLTGAYLRGAGLVEFDREIARTRRTGEPVIVAFIDVDGIRRINDLHGHAAGDEALRDVASAFRSRLRAHDLLIRLGGDEFLCVITGLGLVDATQRLDAVAAATHSAPGHGSASVGVVQLRDREQAGEAIERADTVLYKQRQARGA